MSTEALQHFRGLITERFTAVAVDIFTEVQSLVEAYDQENKRLRSLLNSVLIPEVRLNRIETSEYQTSSSPELVDTPYQSVSHYRQFKEEPVESIVNEGFEPSNYLMVTVKEEPHTSGSYYETVNGTVASSTTVSAPASPYREGSDYCHGDEEESGSMETENGETGTEKKDQKTILEIPRFTKPNPAFLPTPSEFKAFMSRLSDAYKDLPEEERPLITKMGLTEDIEFVDCALGKVPKGSVLSYHYPLPSDSDFKPLDEAPPQPRLPLQSQKIAPFLNIPTLSAKEQVHLISMKLTWEDAYTLEHSSRSDETIIESVKQKRLTDSFKDIFRLKTGRSNAEHLIAKMRRGGRKCKLAQIEKEWKDEALREYCRLLGVNWYGCGLVVHPEAPWLAAIPHGVVYDPKEEISFGLVHVKCLQCRSFIDCNFLAFNKGLQLKTKQAMYWQLQGEMMVTGTTWCDLLVFCEQDILVQRIYRDAEVIENMKNKLDEFFFYYYLPSLFQED